MAPSPPRHGKTQSSMLDYAHARRRTPAKSPGHRRGATPELTPRLPSRSPPVKAMPKPTAPPYFSQSPRRSKRLPSSGSAAEEAWQAAEAALSGKQKSRPVAYSEDGGVLSERESDSEDDFEPVAVKHRVARERPRPTRKNSASGLRDDRTSMKKKARGQGMRGKGLLNVSAQRNGQDVDTRTNRSPRLSVLGLAFQKTQNRSQDREVILVEGNKSEMSGTDRDGSSRSSTPEASVGRHDISRRISLVTPVDRGVEKQGDDVENYKTPEELVFESGVRTPNDSDTKAPRKARVSATNYARRRLTNTLEARSSAPSGECKIRKRARDLPQMFDSESDVEREPPKCRIFRRKGSRFPLAKENSNESPATEDRSQGDSNCLSGRDGQTSPASADRITSRSSARKACKHVSTARTLRPPIKIDISDDDSPAEDGLGYRGRLLTRSAPRSGSKRVSLSPESDPSPPSTKKRRRLSRLAIEDSVDCDVEKSTATNVTPTQLPVELTSTESPRKGTSTAACRGSNEWYQERGIEEYSSSSAELRAVSSPKAMTPTLTPKILVAGTLRRSNIPPVRREILKSFSDDKEENEGAHIISAENTPSESQWGVLPSERRAAHGDRVALDDKDLSDSEAVDLVDAEDFDSCAPHLPAGCVIEKDEIYHSSNPDPYDEKLTNSGGLEAIDVLDDDKPPPFNLRILCEKGESLQQMKDRLGEELVMEKVTTAQSEGREIIGGEELGLTTSFNRGVFNRFSQQVVGDQIGRERKAKSVTEQALRGEYKFNYRGRDQGNPHNSRLKRKGSAAKNSEKKGRLSNLRRRLPQ